METPPQITYSEFTRVNPYPHAHSFTHSQQNKLNKKKS